MPRWNPEETRRYYQDLVQPHVPEPVLAVGALQPAGTWGNFALTKVNPLGGMLGRSRNNKKAGGLAKTGGMRTPTLAGIAVTQDRVYVLSLSTKRGKVQVEELLATWDRADLRITTEPGRLATKVVVDVTSTGEHYELEATNVGDQGLTQTFVDTLTAPA
ncbi:MAG TPA: hypothetical protein VI462_10985 [Acidimicrobiia bacterium]